MTGLRCPLGHGMGVIAPIRGIGYCPTCGDEWNLSVCQGNRVAPGQDADPDGRQCSGCGRTHSEWRERATDGADGGSSGAAASSWVCGYCSFVEAAERGVDRL